ncbi:MAG: hypothetical protein ABIO92_07415, partial [Chloroflexia bacterium]
MKWKIIVVASALILLSSQVILAGDAEESPSAHQNSKFACRCGGFYLRPNDELLNAGAVFTGEVVSIADLPLLDADSVRQKRIVFRVITSWKNASDREIMVDTGPVEDGCGLEFRPGEIWVVYMDKTRVADKCTRTRLLEDAGEDLAQLGRGNPPLSDDLVARVKPVESVERLRGANLFGRLGLAALIVAACLGGPAVYYR